VAGLRPDPVGELTALPQTHSSIKGGGGVGDGNEREVERKAITGSKEKREIKGKGGKLGIMEYVSVHYWQRYRLAPPKNVLTPLWPPHSKKLVLPLH